MRLCNGDGWCDDPASVHVVPPHHPCNPCNPWFLLRLLRHHGTRQSTHRSAESAAASIWMAGTSVLSPTKNSRSTPGACTGGLGAEWIMYSEPSRVTHAHSRRTVAATSRYSSSSMARKAP